MEDLAYIYLAYESAEQNCQTNEKLISPCNARSTQPVQKVIDRDRPQSTQESDYNVDTSTHLYPSFFYV